MKIERIDHLHFYVKDSESAIKKLEDLLGVEFKQMTSLEETETMGFKDAFASPGIDVIQPTTDPTLSKLIQHKGEGLHGIALKVSNIDEAISEFQSKGLRLLTKFQSGSLTGAIFAPLDFLGVTIELCEYPGDDIIAAYGQQPDCQD